MRTLEIDARDATDAHLYEIASDAMDSRLCDARTNDKALQLDTGQLLDETLSIVFHEVHRIDQQEDGGRELVISTLKYFQLYIEAKNAANDLLFHLDGTELMATLVYEDGTPVEALSATLEPPLIACGGDCPPRSVLEGGCATFRLRITVLSSLCNKRSFGVRVTAEGYAHLDVVTAAVKTITKLRRGPRDGGAAANAENRRGGAPSENKRATPLREEEDGVCGASNKRPAGCAPLASPFFDDALLADRASALAHHTLDELWDEVAANGSRLLELQAQQRKLFGELRSLRQLDDPAAAPLRQLEASTAAR